MKSDSIDRVERALAELRAGRLIIVTDDTERENEGDLVGVSELVSADSVNFMVTHARGLVCVTLSSGEAARLNLGPMAPDLEDKHRTAFTVSIDAATSTTGISAAERAETISMLASPGSAPEDFVRPGHIFPLVARAGGVFARRGHTEAATDLARLAGFRPSGYICEIMNPDGSMARADDLEGFAATHGLLIVTVNDLVAYRDARGDVGLTLVSESELPIEHGDFEISVYRSEDPACPEIIILERGGAGTPLVRLHSECLTGEAFGSRRCDCGPQLDRALEQIGKEGGALVYLRQEGRGIGLAEKIKAYALQDRGMDTVDANLALGHPADGRRFGAAAAVLRARGYDRLRLLTNNPEKESSLKRTGIEISERIPLEVAPTKDSGLYLKTKRQRFGHLLELAL
jgi:3,4-dihydroxy 2-butanone 4-phosphate synthase/GTP cyclohydrolase II